MPSPKNVLALHRAPAAPGLAQALEAAGLAVRVTRNMAETWALAREWQPAAIVLDPTSADPDGLELRSLLTLADDPAGPAALVITDTPEALTAHARVLDDFLPTGLDPEAVARRLRFAVARRQALARLHAERENLLKLTITDFKTGLFNDRHFHQRCHEEVSRARRQGQPLGLLMIDFDDFKAINDEHDHAFGDHVLVAFAATLRSRLRDFDVAARLGGDEFAVLLPNTGLPDAVHIAQRVRDTLAETVMSDRGHRTRLSVSIGVASWSPTADQDFDDELKGADQALLQAKRAGRGRVWVFDGEPAAAAEDEPGDKDRSSRGRARKG